MRNKLHLLGLAVLVSLPLTAGAEDAKAPRPGDLTLGAIQRSVKAGMSSSEIMDVAGSPNLVTRGRNGRESWVYDRFSTESSEEGFQVGGGGIG